MEISRQVLQFVGEGEGVLCHGPPLSGKREFLATLFDGAASAGHPALFVTTDETTAGLLDRFPESTPVDTAAIVDCTGAPAPDTDHVVRSVAAAADLTGIAVATSKVLDDLDTGRGPPVVAVDSLTTLTLYSEFDRVFRFVHSFVQQVRGSSGVIAMTVDDDSIDQQERSRLQSLVGTCVEFRGGSECRLVERDGSTGEWSRIADPGTVSVSTGARAIGSVDAGVETPSGGPPRPGSLAALVESVRADRPTLTLGNVPGGSDVEPLAEHAARHGVSVEEQRFGGGEPSGVAMLHRGPTLLATGGVREAVDTLTDPFAAVGADGEEDGTGNRGQSPVLVALPTDVFTADAADRRQLLRASRTVERLALRHGDGTVHAGFQLFSRLTEDADTLAVYERLVDEGLTVHLYGELDASLPDSLAGAVVRGLPAEEVSESWFVVFDGDGETDAGGILVTREVRPDEYDGFWSYDGRVVERTLEYLETEYGAVET